MFKKILLPLDLTDKHEAALGLARELAQQNHGTVILLHVVELIPGLGRDEERTFYDRLERRARDHLARICSHLSAQDVACQAEVIFGHRVQDTVRYAAQQAIDLIVLTSPPFQPEQPALSLGSMSWKISVVATCPVLLVKSQKLS
jgi:nucleotide-binding universal stress UspA family protein